VRERVAIDDFAFLSDCHSAALVHRAGSIDWWCLPRFDSASVFGRLLGPDAGHWSLCPSAEFEVERDYVPDTLVLRTRFITAQGEVTLTDALAFEPGARGHDIGARSPHVLLRRVEASAGDVEMVSDFSPRMEYGLTVPTITRSPDGRVVARGGPVRLTLEGTPGLEAGAVTWLAEAAESDLTRVVVALLVGLVLLAPSTNHAMVGFGEVLFGILADTTSAGWSDLLRNTAVAVAGNVVGGVFLIAFFRGVQAAAE
jgi:GH15 family glucan-1,4-alpha-glucosidase